MEENKGHQEDLERKVFGLSMILAKQLKENQKFTEPDYWDKLLHQYAGMAMQGILSNEELFKATAKNAEEFGLEVRQALAIDAKVYATALVEKLKEKEGK